MKNLAFLVACFFIGYFMNWFAEVGFYKPVVTANYIVDLPEEMPIAKVGDSLEVYKVSEGVIYIGFKY